MDLEDLVLRIPKGSPLTPLEMDEDLDALRDAINGLSALFGVALNPDGSLKSPPFVFGNSTTGTDAYVITPVPAVASLASLIGRVIVMVPDAASTGPATLNVSGLGAQAITKFFNQPLESGDIKAGQYVLLSWDGARYEMQSWPGVVQPTNYALDTGVVNEPAVAASAGSTVSVPAVLVAGYEISVKIAVANTGASNLHIGALTTPIRKNVIVPLEAGDLIVGQIAKFIYDGTNFQLVSMLPTLGTPLPVQVFPPGVATLVFTHSYGFIPSYVRVVLACRVNDIGFVTGEEVGFEALIGHTGPGTDQFRPPVVANSSTVGVNLLPAFTPALNRKDTGAQANITRASWDVKVYVAP